MEQEAKTNQCPACGSPLEASLADLGCAVCLFQAGLESHPSNESGNAHQFGSYQIVRRGDGTPDELGRGTMGITYRALDTTLNREVALKIINPRQHGSDRARERFMREARASGGLRHQNIATIHHFGVDEDRGQYFYAMELVEGETLEERVRRTGPLKWNAVLIIAQQVVAALSAAEKRGLVHRDLKPGNIMLVGTEAETADVKIIDFGLAKAIEDSGDPMTLTRDAFVGSPAFASPEQFAKAPLALDVRSDIFSLGVTLWFALAGQTPFPGKSVEEIRSAQEAHRLPFEQLKTARVPARLMGLLESMLAFESAARPGTAELAARLKRCARLARPSVATLAAAAAIALIGGLIFFVGQLHHGLTPAPNPAAQEAFLKGRYIWNKRSGSDFLTAKEYLERAIALDPQYAPAYAGLADTYQFIANADRQVRDEYYAKAKQMSHRALQLDPALAEPHASLGLIAMNYDWDWPAAEREFKRAISLNPNYATAHHWYAAYLVAQGRGNEAVEQIDRACQLDPLSSIINADAGQILLFAGRVPEAEGKLKEMLKLDPAFAQGHFWLSQVYSVERHYDKALAELKGLERENPNESPNGTAWRGQMGYVYGLAGKQKEAEQMLIPVQEQCATNPAVDHVSLMLIYIGLGRKDEAFACLEDEYRARSTTVTSLKVNPVFASLRSDPRFTDLMRRVHLAP